jgi:hypothetical protein
MQPHDEVRRQEYTTIEVQLGKLEQGLSRLIDSYAEGLLEKQEFEPRISRLRQRIGHLEAQRRQLAEDAASRTELQLIIGRLEDFASQVHDGLAEAPWASKREIIRTLVKRVEIAHDQGKVVFRVEPRPGDSGPLKKKFARLQEEYPRPPAGYRAPGRSGVPLPAPRPAATSGLAAGSLHP